MLTDAIRSRLTPCLAWRDHPHTKQGTRARAPSHARYARTVIPPDAAAVWYGGATEQGNGPRSPARQDRMDKTMTSVDFGTTVERISKGLKEEGKINVSLEESLESFDIAENMIQAVAEKSGLAIKMQRNKKSVTARVEDSK